MRRLFPLPATDIEDLYDLYELPDTPHLRAGFVQSVDGAIAVDGSSKPLSGPADRQALRTLRAVADVVLVGAGTARAEDYGPLPLPAELCQRRRAAGRSELPVLAVATRDAETLDPGSRLFSNDSATVLVLAGAGGGALPDNVDVVVIDPNDAGSLIRALHDRGLHRVLCEGGPQLFAQLLAADLVDELCLTWSPQLVGGPGLLPVAPSATRPLALTGLVEDEGVLLTRWSVGG